jgi:hypothetical protein
VLPWNHARTAVALPSLVPGSCRSWLEGLLHQAQSGNDNQLWARNMGAEGYDERHAKADYEQLT